MPDQLTSIHAYLIPADRTPHRWWSHKAYILVRAETADGVVGWGECHNIASRVEETAEIVNAIAPAFLGKPVDDISTLRARALNNLDQQPALYSAVAGIEIALWDILGKQKKMPVWQLLGKAVHEKIPVYANIFSPHPQKPEDFAEMAAAQVAAGYTLIKLYPFEEETTISDGVAILQAVREAVGPDIGLAVDLWQRADLYRAIELALAMEPFNLVWLEDPFPPADAKAMRRLRDSITQPLLTGERLPAQQDFTRLLEERSVDIINPDICLTGILELQAVAALANSAAITVSPHNSNSMALGTAAAIHAGMGIANLAPLEYFPLFETSLDALCSGRYPVVDGAISRPSGMGLGIEFDDGAMAAFRW